MQLQRKLISVAAVAVILTGCASTNSEQMMSTKDGYHQYGNVIWDKTGDVATSFNNNSIPTNQSRLIFIRAKDAADLQTSANIGIDNLYQTSLQGGHYSSVYVCGGKHKISVIPTSVKTNNLQQNAKVFVNEVGKTQYYYVDLDNNNKLRLRQITAESALTALQNTGYTQQIHQISRVIPEDCATAVKEPAYQPVKPMPETVVKVEADKPISLHVEFDFDKATIRPAYNARLQAVAKFMEDRPNTLVLIEGHTDNRGRAAYNQGLSERRAATVKQELITIYGVDAARISFKGFGESRPVATNDTDAGRQRNRRVDALITVKK